MKILRSAVPFMLLLTLVVAASSCKKNKDAKAIITVLQDSVNFVTQDTVEVPAVQASVRFYSNQIGAEHIDTTILTSSSGKAEFIWPYPAIILYDVSFGVYQSLENFIILKESETEEVTVNIDHP